MTRIRLLMASYSLVLLSLFFYSFTQVDLGLTLTRVSIWQKIQTSFQHIGYFDRPLSTLIYIVILSLLFAFYFVFLLLAHKNRIKRKYVWIVILFAGLLLAFSYNAFSHDIFNYIFHAKIFTHYHQNPYFHKPLDYPSDPMLGFMHWTHSSYSYGPVWLGVTIPLSYLGLNFFLPTFFIFKSFISVCFLASCFLIEKISKKIKLNSVFSLVFFALNPLVIIEVLVSGHNDIFMLMLALLGIYLLFSNKKYLAPAAIVVSALVKSVTAVILAPTLLYLINFKKIRDPQIFMLSCVLFSTIGLVYVLTKLEMQPWYFLWVFPFITLLKPNKFVISITVGFSLGLLLSYTLFLYQGNWSGIEVYKPAAIILSTVIVPAALLIANGLIKIVKLRFLNN